MSSSVNDPGLQMTPEAIGHLQQALAKSDQGSAIGIRVGVKKAGCSGYEYVLEYVYPDSLGDDSALLDSIFEYDGAKIIIDKEIYSKYFKGGTTLDYRREGLNEGFKFDNPNVSSQCGCGESFNLTDEADD